MWKLSTNVKDQLSTSVEVELKIQIDGLPSSWRFAAGREATSISYLW